MNEVTKNYSNGERLTIFDDGKSEVNLLKATLSKVFTAPDGEEYVQVEVEGTVIDLEVDIARVTEQIASLTAHKATLESRKTALETELAKLPERIKEEEERV